MTVIAVGFDLVDLCQQQNQEKRGRSHPVSLRIGSTEPIRECLDREANLSPLGSALGLQTTVLINKRVNPRVNLT